MASCIVHTLPPSPFDYKDFGSCTIAKIRDLLTTWGIEWHDTDKKPDLVDKADRHAVQAGACPSVEEALVSGFTPESWSISQIRRFLISQGVDYEYSAKKPRYCQIFRANKERFGRVPKPRVYSRSRSHSIAPDEDHDDGDENGIDGNDSDDDGDRYENSDDDDNFYDAAGFGTATTGPGLDTCRASSTAFGTRPTPARSATRSVEPVFYAEDDEGLVRESTEQTYAPLTPAPTSGSRSRSASTAPLRGARSKWPRRTGSAPPDRKGVRFEDGDQRHRSAWGTSKIASDVLDTMETPPALRLVLVHLVSRALEAYEYGHQDQADLLFAEATWRMKQAPRERKSC